MQIQLPIQHDFNEEAVMASFEERFAKVEQEIAELKLKASSQSPNPGWRWLSRATPPEKIIKCAVPERIAESVTFSGSILYVLRS